VSSLGLGRHIAGVKVDGFALEFSSFWSTGGGAAWPCTGFALALSFGN
jgi:hypothetical protein